MFTTHAQATRRVRPQLRTLLIVLVALLLTGAAGAPAARASAPRFQIFLPVLQSASAGPGLQTQEQRSRAEEVVRLVNLERARAGCAALTIDLDLVEAAQLHSADMADRNYFDHTGSDGSDFVARARAAGYVGAPGGENIAAGYPTPADVLDGWMDSTGHRANILACDYTTIGVGYAFNTASTFDHYWTQVFGR